jgi:superoxide dismutase
MTYRIAPLFCRPWTLNNMSPRLIESHYEHNYGAALNRLNAVTSELEALDVKTAPAQVISRLSREQTTLLNSTLLHELYFASLGGDGRTLSDAIASALTRDFGSVDRWRHEFIALAEALTGDAGWILLTYVPRDGRLINHSVSGHAESIAGGIPIRPSTCMSTHTTSSTERTRRHTSRPSCVTFTGTRSSPGTAMLPKSRRRDPSINRNSGTCHPSRRKRSRAC